MTSGSVCSYGELGSFASALAHGQGWVCSACSIGCEAASAAGGKLGVCGFTGELSGFGGGADTPRKDCTPRCNALGALVRCPCGPGMKGAVFGCQLLNRNTTPSFPTDGTPQGQDAGPSCSDSFLFSLQVSTQAKSG